jgi:hypothetical protein
MNFDINVYLNQLKKRRKLFHNERDLQFELAWEIQKQAKKNHYKIRLEYCFPEMEENKRSYVDIAVFDEGTKECALIELKYKTKSTEPNAIEVDGETFNLKNQSARDYGSYAVLNDLNRLEGKLGDYVGDCEVKKIYSIFLTNDGKYEDGFKKNTLFYNFGLEDNKEINPASPLTFILPRNKASLNETCAKNFHNLTFSKQYTIKWQNYSSFLRYIILEG